MCAEYTVGQAKEIEKLLEELAATRNTSQNEFENARIFPRGTAPIVRKAKDGVIELIDAEFSLIPSWWNPEKAEKKTKNNRPVFATHNARLESIDEKPTFKESFQKRHCLVPISSFFESSVFGNQFAGNRVKITTGEILMAAGCFSEWIDKATGELVTSFTIITSAPINAIFEAGHDRMPVFLDLKSGRQWLENENASYQELKDFLLKNRLSQGLHVEISIDRALKPGWEKNAPDESTLKEIKKLLGK